MSAAEVMAYVRREYWRLARLGRHPYRLSVVPATPKRSDHRDRPAQEPQ